MRCRRRVVGYLYPDSWDSWQSPFFLLRGRALWTLRSVYLRVLGNTLAPYCHGSFGSVHDRHMTRGLGSCVYFVTSSTGREKRVLWALDNWTKPTLIRKYVLIRVGSRLLSGEP